MGKRKKVEDTNTPSASTEEKPAETTELVVVTPDSHIGRKGAISQHSNGEYWTVVKQRTTEYDMVVVEFENGFVCNAEVVKWKE